MNLDDSTPIQDTRFKTNLSAPVLIGHEDQRPRPRRVAFVDDDRLPPPSIARPRASPDARISDSQFARHRTTNSTADRCPDQTKGKADSRQGS
eukprot:9300385-Pyramimonas_sp.AAC.1